MDIQIILIFILALLTVNLMVVGFYVILVLKEFRQSIKKSNEIMDDIHGMTHAVSNPVTSLIGVVGGVVEGIKAVKGISTLVDFTKKEKEEK
jgi:hypothetical protein